MFYSTHKEKQMKTKLTLLATTLLTLSLIGCNSGGSTPALHSTQSVGTQSAVTQQELPMQTFQAVAQAKITQLGFFDKVDEENNYVPISSSDLTDVTSVTTIGVGSGSLNSSDINQYSLDGTLIDSFSISSPWIGTFQLTQEEINQVSNIITPTNAFSHLLQVCSDSAVFNPEDVKLYSYTFSIPTGMDRSRMYTFNLKHKTQHRANECFQAQYNIENGDVDCLAYQSVACN